MSALAVSQASGEISLHEYSTFQYMLAPPSLAVRVGDQITSVIFYDGPKQLQDSGGVQDETSAIVNTTGYLRLSSYYICCLLVLPSHIMGMSRFVRAEDRSGCNEAPTGEEGKEKVAKVLRHFIYSYYCGLLKVDTYHIQDANEKAGTFRLVEYMDTWVATQVSKCAEEASPGVRPGLRGDAMPRPCPWLSSHPADRSPGCVYICV